LNRLISLSLIALLLPLAQSGDALAREAYQMQNPAGPAPTGPVTGGFLQQPGNNPFAGINTSGGQNGSFPGMAPAGGGAPGMGGAPRFPIGGGANNIIQQILSTRIPTGTVLTGTLNDDLSSQKSETGDLFSIVLTDGFFLNGIEVIPRNARIVGTVVAVTKAGSQRGMGMPGTVEIGLTTLVFPDGRSIPFGGNLDHNPASIQKKPPKVANGGFGLGSYGQQVTSMFNSFGQNSGYLRSIRNRGPEFDVKKGTLVPVKVNRTLDLTKMVAPLVPPSTTAFGPSPSVGTNLAGSALPGTANSGTPGGLLADPTRLQFPPTQTGQPLLPRELPEPF
jgi:hypothetical protein